MGSYVQPVAFFCLKEKNPFLLTDLTHHSWTDFQILTSHGVNVFKRYLYATRSKRLMTFFTLRAETHTITDQLWSVAHLSSLLYPSIPPCRSGWHCSSVGALGTPLSILKRHRLYQLFFPGFPLEALLYFHLESGAVSNGSYRVVSRWTTLLGAISPWKWGLCFSLFQLKLQALSPKSV